MALAVALSLVSPNEQSFIPGAFGGGSQVVLNTTSTDDILNQLSNVHNALNAQKENQAAAPLDLISTGCYLNGTDESLYNGTGVRAADGWRDCMVACSNPSTMFNSSYTWWNCLTLGAASLYQETQGMDVDAGSVSSLGETFGFESLNQFNGTQILSDSVQCIKASCQDYSLGSCSKNITTLDISGSQDKVLALFDGLQNYCSGMDSVVDSDIAGPGVCDTRFRRKGMLGIPSIC